MTPIAHILFPFDFSTAAEQTAPMVSALARHFGARVTLFSVVPPAFELAPTGMSLRVGDDPAVWKAALQSQLSQTLTDALAGLSVERVADVGDPAIRSVQYANRHGVDLIMLPTHGLGLFRRVVLGSVTAEVLHSARCPVWTAAHAEAQHAPAVPRTILYTTDGTPAAAASLDWAARFSEACGAALHILHVIEPVADWPSLDAERNSDESRARAGSRIEAIMRSAGIEAPWRVAVGPIVQTVAEQARQERADLIVIGRGAIAEPGRLRTHSLGIIQNAPCPVLSVS